MNTGITLHGSGTATIEFLVGTFRYLQVSASVPDVTVPRLREVTTQRLVMSEASYFYCDAQVDYSGDETFLSIRITTGADCSIIYHPLGYRAVAVGEKKTETFSWSRRLGLELAGGTGNREQDLYRTMSQMAQSK